MGVVLGSWLSYEGYADHRDLHVRTNSFPARRSAGLHAAGAVGSFAGTGGRFELRGEARGMRVIDDYAHHPTEVAAVRAAARADGAGRLIVDRKSTRLNSSP